MSPAKRKAGRPVGRPKKVRIGEESVIGADEEVATTGTAAAYRPKRTPTGEPQYNFTRRRLTSTSKVEDENPNLVRNSSTDTTTKKRRGRPPKNASKEASSDRAVGSVKLTQNGKKVGRPRKSDLSHPATPVVPAVSRSARLQIRNATKGMQTATRSSQTTTKSDAGTKTASENPVAKKRGRPKGTTNAGESQNVISPSPPQGLDIDITVYDDADVDTLSNDPSEDDDEVDARQYWLMKAEPDSRIVGGIDVKFSIDDLMLAPEPEPWDGVRNPVARNNMRAMRKGDLAFFYHSNCAVPGVVGILQIVQEHTVDESAFNPNHPYYDPKSDPAKPKWECVHVSFVRKFPTMIGLKQLKAQAAEDGPLKDMQTLKQSRLSVSSVSPKEWRAILKMAGEHDVSMEELQEAKEVRTQAHEDSDTDRDRTA